MEKYSAMNPYEPHHWRTICQLVSEKALSIFPHIKSKKLKSEIISNLFETQSEQYFKSIGYNITSAKSDRDPDLLINQKPLEIKVTGIDHPFTNHAKWMGGKYSKRTSDYAFVMWHYQGTNNNLYDITPERILFAVLKCHVDENEWRTIDNGNENYYATIFELKQVLSREHIILVGENNNHDILCCNT
jgi:hypothetical protein